MSRRIGRLAAVAAVLALAGCSSSGSGDRGRPARAAAATTGPTTTTAARFDPATVPADPSTGCGTPPDVARIQPDQRPGDVPQSLTVAGVERTYRLGVPQAYDPDTPAPLVLNLHGSGSNALQAGAYGDVPREAAKRGMITVAPDAIGGNWELGGKGADNDFLMALTDDVEARYCIDRNREHIVGMSLGAWKAGVTACANPGRFASISLVTVEVFPGTCRPIAIQAFHGRADRTVPYGDGAEVDRSETRLGTLPGARDNIARWARSGGCRSTPTITELGDDVELRRFTGCDPGVDVELYSIDGGGHTWPGADIDLGPASWTTHTISATTLALDWFEAHPRRR